MTSLTQSKPGRLEKTALTIGYIPLTDCASVVMASELGLFRKYGLDVTVSKEASWASIRDKLVLGQLDAAHSLYGLIYGVHLGLTGQPVDMAILMGLSQNGQAITLSRALAEAGVRDGNSLGRLIREDGARCTFAQTFPTGTHAMWLYYWLAAHGIDPFRDARAIVIPPPQMVDTMRAGTMDGFCAGEPWGARAIAEGVGFTVSTSQAIWRNHPEKVLGTTRSFVERNPSTARALVMAILEASIHLDELAQRGTVASQLSDSRFVGAPRAILEPRFLGRYDDGLGKQWDDADPVRFFGNGDVTFPYYSHGMWFMTQQRRWGLIRQDIDYLDIATQVNQVALYTDAARTLDVPIPASPMKTETLFDGTVWNPQQAADYAKGFAIRS